jgi:hypothetical protein
MRDDGLVLTPKLLQYQKDTGYIELVNRKEKGCERQQ